MHEGKSGLACSDTMREKKEEKETLKASDSCSGVIRNEIMKMKMPQSYRNDTASL